jgi:hypothetical protein
MPVVFIASASFASCIQLQVCTVCPSSLQYGHFFTLGFFLLLSTGFACLAQLPSSASSFLPPHIAQLMVYASFPFLLNNLSAFLMVAFIARYCQVLHLLPDLDSLHVLFVELCYFSCHWVVVLVAEHFLQIPLAANHVKLSSL